MKLGKLSWQKYLNARLDLRFVPHYSTDNQEASCRLIHITSQQRVSTDQSHNVTVSSLSQLTTTTKIQVSAVTNESV